jgi:hypothetical protein
VCKGDILFFASTGATGSSRLGERSSAASCVTDREAKVLRVDWSSAAEQAAWGRGALGDSSRVL